MIIWVMKNGSSSGNARFQQEIRFYLKMVPKISIFPVSFGFHQKIGFKRKIMALIKNRFQPKYYGFWPENRVYPKFYVFQEKFVFTLKRQFSGRKINRCPFMPFIISILTDFGLKKISSFFVPTKYR